MILDWCAELPEKGAGLLLTQFQPSPSPVVVAPPGTPSSIQITSASDVGVGSGVGVGVGSGVGVGVGSGDGVGVGLGEVGVPKKFKTLEPVSS